MTRTRRRRWGRAPAMRGTVAALFAALLALVLAGCADAAGPKLPHAPYSAKPNIVFVLTDDLETLQTPTGQVLLRSPHPVAVVGLPDGQVLERSGDTVVVREDDPAALNARLVAAGIAVTELTPLRRSLEQVVLAVTGAGSDRVDRSGR